MISLQEAPPSEPHQSSQPRGSADGPCRGLSVSHASFHAPSTLGRPARSLFTETDLSRASARGHRRSRSQSCNSASHALVQVPTLTHAHREAAKLPCAVFWAFRGPRARYASSRPTFRTTTWRGMDVQLAPVTTHSSAKMYNTSPMTLRILPLSFGTLPHPFRGQLTGTSTRLRAGWSPAPACPTLCFSLLSSPAQLVSFLSVSGNRRPVSRLGRIEHHSFSLSACALFVRPTSIWHHDTMVRSLPERLTEEWARGIAACGETATSGHGGHPRCGRGGHSSDIRPVARNSPTPPARLPEGAHARGALGGCTT